MSCRYKVMYRYRAKNDAEIASAASCAAAKSRRLNMASGSIG